MSQKNRERVFVVERHLKKKKKSVKQQQVFLSWLGDYYLMIDIEVVELLYCCCWRKTIRVFNKKKIPKKIISFFLFFTIFGCKKNNSILEFLSLYSLFFPFKYISTLNIVETAKEKRLMRFIY